MGWLICLVLVAVALTAAAALFHPLRDGMGALRMLVRQKFPGVRHVSPSELATLLARNEPDRPVLLDVREPAAFAISHLPGARSVPDDSTLTELLATLPRGCPVIVYCHVGYSASELAARLAATGHAALANLDGGIFQWANEGRPLERDGQPVREVHPYSELFRRLLRPELWP